MLTARPEVKRTYSRLKKESIEEKESKEDIDEKITFTPETIDVSMTCEDLGIVKVDKLRKITDFFKVKRCEEANKSPKKPSDNELLPLSSPLTSVSNKLKQTYLELGQKNLISIQCPDCQMHYNKSFLDDVNLHKKFHANYLKGFNFNLKVDGDIVAEIAPKDLMKWTKIRFYEIKKFDAKIFKKLEFFLNFVHIQLGAESLTLEELHNFDSIVAVEHLTDKILAIGLFEKCSKVFKSRQNCSDSSIELETDRIIRENSDDFIGVSRIWTDERHRSIGLARTLLDLKCKERRDIVAFSQPTPAGFAFAKSYQKFLFEGNQCLIYLK